eukprot:UC1_evm1s1954
MENYKISKKLGKGAQGSVFLCTDTRDSKQYVLKKVECNDESEANKAFQEAMALEQLTHQYICGYREFFVNWDKQEETMYVCIVMDFYETGDLENVLKQQRAKEKALPEPILKKWFGQMVEALHFVHAKKVIHRDLKPSNIFMTKALDISIGDFGVATVMNDARTRTRTTVGTMNWMAPEVIERPYDERSDIWSLGCILLDAATCGFMDHAESMSTLFEIKHSSQRLETVLKTVGETYSKDLCAVIRSMLRRIFQQRPSAAELVQLPFVRSCLALSKSELVAGDRKRDAPGNKTKPTTTKKIPGTVPEILAFMETNKERVGCLVMGMEEMQRLIERKGLRLDDAAVAAVVRHMCAQIDNVFVQIAGCQTLRLVVPKSEPGSAVFAQDVTQAVMLAMRAQASSPELHEEAVGLLWQLSVDEEAAGRIGASGGVQDVLASLRDNIDVAGIAQAACGALWSLAVKEENARIATEEQAVQDISEAMQKHDDNADLIEYACAALWSLSVEDENIDVMFDLGVVPDIVAAMQTHIKSRKLVKQAATALSSIVVDENCAWAIFKNDDGIDGLPVIVAALRAHVRDAEVCESLCALLSELAEHDELREYLLEAEVAELLEEVKAQYPDDKELVEDCDRALDLLAGE